MRKEYDLSRARRAKDLPNLAKPQATARGETRITIMVDNLVLEAFRQQAESHPLLMLRTAQASFSTGSQSHLLNSPCRHRHLSGARAKLTWRFACLRARSVVGVPIIACGGKLRVIACSGLAGEDSGGAGAAWVASGAKKGS